MAHSFDGMKSLPNLDEIGSWQINSLEDASYAFANTGITNQLATMHWPILGTMNLTGMFAGSHELATVDISYWDTTNCTVTDMFKELRSLGADTGYLKVSGFSTLMGTSLDGISTRLANQGMWVRQETTPIEWFGNGNSLIKLYPATGKGVNEDTNVFTYSWDPTRLGGRFESNPYVWWIFYPNALGDHAAKTLTIGSDPGCPSHRGDRDQHRYHRRSRQRDQPAALARLQRAHRRSHRTQGQCRALRRRE